MATEWSGFSAILAARGVDPSRTKLYRHTKHPDFGPVAFDRWNESKAHFLSFATYQNAAARIYGKRVEWCAHFLATEIEGVKHAARFLGVTKILGETRPFDENFPVAGYLPGEATPSRLGVRRLATPLAWEPWEEWEGLSERMVIDWGDAPRTTAQWAKVVGKTVLIEGEIFDTLEPGDMHLAVYESRVLRLHLSYERRGSAARLAKELKPLRCEGCELDGVASFGAALAARCMEAHHLTPVAKMPARGRMVRPLTDFAILCATCHRLIHGLPRPDDLTALQALWAVQG